MDSPDDIISTGIQVGILKELYKEGLLTEKQMLYCIDLITPNKKITDEDGG